MGHSPSRPLPCNSPEACPLQLNSMVELIADMTCRATWRSRHKAPGIPSAQSFDNRLVNKFSVSTATNTYDCGELPASRSCKPLAWLRLTRHARMCSYMLVQWTTRDAGTPTVRLGTAPGTYTQTFTGNCTTYAREGGVL